VKYWPNEPKQKRAHRDWQDEANKSGLLVKSDKAKQRPPNDLGGTKPKEERVPPEIWQNEANWKGVPNRVWQNEAKNDLHAATPNGLLF
jgi:hypothetical protein